MKNQSQHTRVQPSRVASCRNRGRTPNRGCGWAFGPADRCGSIGRDDRCSRRAGWPGRDPLGPSTAQVRDGAHEGTVRNRWLGHGRGRARQASAPTKDGACGARGSGVQYGAAADGDDVAGDVGGHAGGEEEGEVGDVGGRDHSSRKYSTPYFSPIAIISSGFCASSANKPSMPAGVNQKISSASTSDAFRN